MPNQKPDQLSAALKAGNPQRIYLFDGPENWLKERCIGEFEAKYITPETRDLNFVRYSGKNASAADINSTAQSLPFLGEKRIMVVDQTEEFSAAEQKIIAESISDLPKSTCLIFLYQGKAPLREPIPAQVMSKGAVVTFWTPFENQLPGWITGEVKRRGKTMTWDAARTLAESCSGLQDISNELDKLILYIGNNAQISLTDVLNFGLPDSAGDYFELEEAIWHRNLPLALQQGELLDDLGKRGESIFPLFERVFRQIVLGHFYINEKKMRFDEIFTLMRIRSVLQQRKFQSGLKLYNKDDSRSALRKVVQADFDLKTGKLPSSMAVSLLMVNVLGRKESLAFR